MSRVARMVARTAVLGWAVALDWPIIGAAVPGLAPERVPGLHLAVTLLASCLTVSWLVPHLMAGHARTFASGMLFQDAQRREPEGEDTVDSKVVNLLDTRHRHRPVRDTR